MVPPSSGAADPQAADAHEPKPPPDGHATRMICRPPMEISGIPTSGGRASTIQVQADHLREAASVHGSGPFQASRSPGWVPRLGQNSLRQVDLWSSRGRTRTCDPPVNSRLLYQLSYSGMCGGRNIVSGGRYFNRGWGAACSGLRRHAAICGALRAAAASASPPHVSAPRRRRTTARPGPASRRAAACP